MVLLGNEALAQDNTSLNKTELIILITVCSVAFVILVVLGLSWVLWWRRKRAKRSQKETENDNNRMLNIRLQSGAARMNTDHHLSPSHYGLSMTRVPNQAQWMWMPAQLKAEQSAAMKIFSQPTVHTRGRDNDPKAKRSSQKDNHRSATPKQLPGQQRTPSPTIIEGQRVRIHHPITDEPRDGQQTTDTTTTTTNHQQNMFPIFRPEFVWRPISSEPTVSTSPLPQGNMTAYATPAHIVAAQVNGPEVRGPSQSKLQPPAASERPSFKYPPKLTTESIKQETKHVLKPGHKQQNGAKQIKVKSPTKNAERVEKKKKKEKGHNPSKAKLKSKMFPKKVDFVIQCDSEDIDSTLLQVKREDMGIDLSMFDPVTGTRRQSQDNLADVMDSEAEARVAALFDDIFSDEKYTGGIALTSDSEDEAESKSSHESLGSVDRERPMSVPCT